MTRSEHVTIGAIAIILLGILVGWNIGEAVLSVKVVEQPDISTYIHCMSEQAQGWHARNGKLLRWQAEAICKEQTRGR